MSEFPHPWEKEAWRDTSNDPEPVILTPYADGHRDGVVAERKRCGEVLLAASHCSCSDEWLDGADPTHEHTIHNSAECHLIWTLEMIAVIKEVNDGSNN